MKNKVDMINGNLAKNIIVFSVPIILTSVLQLLFSACDMIVVGKFAGNNALAAVGATGALYNLIVSVFLGVSVGVNVVAAQFFGKKNEEDIGKTVHTAISLGGILGVILTFVGIIVVKPCLQLMNTPDEIINLSVLYMRIYFLGMPGMIVYNFGAAILRANGNTKSPLTYLTIGGIVNVLLNLLLVIVFDLSVAGVSIATAASYYISCVLVLIHLKKYYGLDFKELKLVKPIVKKIFYIGIPSGFNSMVFAFANMQIQSSLNSFGAEAVAGCAAAGSIEGFIYVAMNAITQAATSFSGQNYGAGTKDRIPKVLKWSLLYVFILGIVSSFGVLLFDEHLLSLYISGNEAISFGVLRLQILLILYFLCGFMEIPAAIVRGMGYAMVPTVISLIGACGLRVLWIATIFKMFPSVTVLYASLPVSWIVTFAVQLIYYRIIMKRENIK